MIQRIVDSISLKMSIITHRIELENLEKRIKRTREILEAEIKEAEERGLK